MKYQAVFSAFSAALVSWWFAAALEIPVWRQWEAGDRCDIAVFTFAAVFFAVAREPTP